MRHPSLSLGCTAVATVWLLVANTGFADPPPRQPSAQPPVAAPPTGWDAAQRCREAFTAEAEVNDCIVRALCTQAGDARCRALREVLERNRRIRAPGPPGPANPDVPRLPGNVSRV